MPFGTVTITSQTTENLFRAGSHSQPIGTTNDAIVLEYGPYDFETLDANSQVSGTASATINAANPNAVAPLIPVAMAPSLPSPSAPTAPDATPVNPTST